MIFIDDPTAIPANYFNHLSSTKPWGIQVVDLHNLCNLRNAMMDSSECQIRFILVFKCLAVTWTISSNYGLYVFAERCEIRHMHMNMSYVMPL